MTKENVFWGGLTGLGAYFLGLPWELLYCWTLLMLIDIVTGIISACMRGEFSSKAMKHGLFHKTADISVMISLLIIQRVAELNGIIIPFGSALIGAFCFKELSSILENYGIAGGRLPETVQNWLKVVGSKLNKGDDNEDSNNKA